MIKSQPCLMLNVEDSKVLLQYLRRNKEDIESDFEGFGELKPLLKLLEPVMFNDV